MTKLIHIADPMCSWCYGFGPELAALLEGLPGLGVDVIVGGLRPYAKEPMRVEDKDMILAHWRTVEERTGLPFDPNTIQREGFVYDTEPACRAVVAARMLAPATTLYVLHEIQRAFYANGRDTTDACVLAEVCTAAMAEAGSPVSEADFLATWASEDAIRATNEDFMLVHRWGVTGFPTVLLEQDGQLDLVSSGYATLPQLVELLQGLVATDAEAG